MRKKNKIKTTDALWQEWLDAYFPDPDLIPPREWILTICDLRDAFLAGRASVNRETAEDYESSKRWFGDRY